MKWKITPYNQAGEVIDRGVRIVPGDVDQDELTARMGASYHRCAKGSVAKIIVTDEANAVVHEWEPGGVELPRPEKRVKQMAKESKVKAKKEAVARQAKPKVAKPPKAKGGLRGEPQQKGYKGHRQGSRKAEAHKLYDELGAEAAKKKVRELDIKDSTISSWFAGWRKK